MNTPDTATTAGKIAVMAAFEHGEKIQFLDRCQDKSWQTASTPNWNWHIYDYRIAPPSIASGHNPDKLTEKQVDTKEGWRLLAPEEIRGRNVTFDIQLYDKSWRILAASGSNEKYTYRTLRPPGYFLPKTRPLRKEDWDGLPVVWVKNPNNNAEAAVMRIDDVGFICCGIRYSWNADTAFTWSTDRKTWRPFIIEE